MSEEEQIEEILEEANAYNLRNEVKEKELNENFQIMYGKEASFINPKNINEVTKTLNSLFLEKNLIS